MEVLVNEVCACVDTVVSITLFSEPSSLSNKLESAVKDDCSPDGNVPDGKVPTHYLLRYNEVVIRDTKLLNHNNHLH